MAFLALGGGGRRPDLTPTWAIWQSYDRHAEDRDFFRERYSPAPLPNGEASGACARGAYNGGTSSGGTTNTVSDAMNPFCMTSKARPGIAWK